MWLKQGYFDNKICLEQQLNQNKAHVKCKFAQQKDIDWKSSLGEAAISLTGLGVISEKLKESNQCSHLRLYEVSAKSYYFSPQNSIYLNGIK